MRVRTLCLRLCLGLLAGLCTGAWAQLNVNTASQAELEALKGVGPQLSEAILAARRDKPFRDWADFTAPAWHRPGARWQALGGGAARGRASLGTRPGGLGRIGTQAVTACSAVG